MRTLLRSLLLLCWPLSVAAQPMVATLAMDDAYPPYSHIEHEQPAGLYVQLLQRAAQGVPGWTLRLAPMPWGRALREAEQGAVDGVLPPYRGLGRDWIALYAGPLHREEVVLNCASATGIGPASRWPDDFNGLRIGTMRGYLLSQALSDAVEHKKLSKLEFRNGRDALAALAGGQIDCYANDRLSIEIAHQQALADPIWAKRVPARLEPAYLLSSQQAYVGFSQQALNKRPELAEFARALDAQLAQLRASGEMQRLVGLYKPR